MKKYRIKDEDGVSYEVEEIENEATPKDKDPKVCDEELSPEEIGALKRLAAHADELVALLTKTDSKEEKVDDEEEKVDDEEEKVDEEELKDSDEEEEKVDEEEIIDTDEPCKGKDSKSSVGSLLRKTNTNDSKGIDSSIEIEQAWAKRYGGK